MAIDPNDIAHSARRALMKAQRRYERLTGLWWRPSPEYVGTVYIMDALSRIDGVEWLIPEHGAVETLQDAQGGVGRRP